MVYNNNQETHTPFLVSFLMVSLMFCGFYVAYDLGVFIKILDSDSTRISLLILVLFVLTLCHSIWQSWRISQQYNMFLLVKRVVQREQKLMPMFLKGQSFAQDYLLLSDESSSKSKRSGAQESIQGEVLAEKLRSGNQVGWFSASLMIKFGLLGTVVGFAIMLGSIVSVETLEVSDIKNLMQLMTSGMRVAMNTTIIGLICSVLLGLQYFVLDYFSDRLLVNILEIEPFSQTARD